VLWYGLVCAPKLCETRLLTDVIPANPKNMQTLCRLALGKEDGDDDFLRAAAANLIVWLAFSSPEHLAVIPDNSGDADSGLIELCAKAIEPGLDPAAPVALYALQKATASDPRGAGHLKARRVFVSAKCGKLLAAMVLGERGDVLRTIACDVLLNVSVERAANAALARAALDPLLALSEDPFAEPAARHHAKDLLANLSRHAGTRRRGDKRWKF